MEPLIAPVLDFVCPSSRVSEPEWISCQHSFLLACVPKVTSGATPAFSTNRVHCISMYKAWQPSHLPVAVRRIHKHCACFSDCECVFKMGYMAVNGNVQTLRF